MPFILHAESYQHCNNKLDALLHSSKYKTDIYTSKMAKKVLLDHSTRRFRTQFQTALDTHPKEVMAGHYVTTAWGCGAPCYGIVWVDLKTGRAYIGPSYSYSSETLADSMIIINDRPESQEQIDKMPSLRPMAYQVTADGGYKTVYACKFNHD